MLRVTDFLVPLAYLGGRTLGRRIYGGSSVLSSDDLDITVLVQLLWVADLLRSGPLSVVTHERDK